MYDLVVIFRPISVSEAAKFFRYKCKIYPRSVFTITPTEGAYIGDRHMPVFMYKYYCSAFISLRSGIYDVLCFTFIFIVVYVPEESLFTADLFYLYPTLDSR